MVNSTDNYSSKSFNYFNSTNKSQNVPNIDLSIVGQMITSDNIEKNSVLLNAFDAREDSIFCDVSFIVQGTIFRAHKVIVW